MRFNCGVKLKLPFLFFLCLFTLKVFSQSRDSIPAGVIVVHRAPVSASFSVQMTVIYRDNKSYRKQITEISTQQIVFTDSVRNAFAPVPIREGLNSDNGFDWIGYISETNYSFAWADSVRSDSARFIFSVDKNGFATCDKIPILHQDSTGEILENVCYYYLGKLSKWQPARKAKRLGGKQEHPNTKRVASFAIITVTAFDANKGKLMPIEIVPK